MSPTKTTVKNLPWLVIFIFYLYKILIYKFKSRVEKYRPAKLEDLISHEEIINTSKIFFMNCLRDTYRIRFFTLII